MDDITICVTTFERPRCLTRCVESIRTHYPNTPILVGDNSKEPTAVPGAELVVLPFDCGVSATRNQLLAETDTELVVFCDDDFVFGPDTRIESLKHRLQRDRLDVCAGMVTRGHPPRESHYEGLLEIEDRVLHYRRGDRDGLFDIVFNFFLARTAALRSIGWDPDLKLAEHTEFFLRAKGKLRVGYEPSVQVHHAPSAPDDYAAYRARGWEYAKMMLTKHGLIAAVAFDGTRFP